MITKEDILGVVKDLNFTIPTEYQIKQLIEEHESYAETDPTGNWILWLEQQLCDMDLDKKPTFRVYAESVSTYYVDVVADNEEDAMEIAENKDGGEFKKDGLGYWDVTYADKI